MVHLLLHLLPGNRTTDLQCGKEGRGPDYERGRRTPSEHQKRTHEELHQTRPVHKGLTGLGLDRVSIQGQVGVREVSIWGRVVQVAVVKIKSTLSPHGGFIPYLGVRLRLSAWMICRRAWRRGTPL